MAIDLNTWVPKLILEVLADRGGQTITAEDWNALWNKNTTQGDDTANALYAVLTQLRDTVWHATEGAKQITNPAVTTEDNPALTVAAQLLWAGALLDQLKLLLGTDGANNLNKAGVSVADSLDALSAVDTDLAQQISALQVGAISAFNHNDISGRDTVEAHPATAIQMVSMNKDVETELNDLALDMQNAFTNQTNHTNTAGTKHAATNLSADRNGTSTTVQALLDSLFATVASLTGNISEIVHADLSGRDAAGSHPMSAITDLVTALAGKQPKILYGTTVPANTLGNDGDVYIMY